MLHKLVAISFFLHARLIIASAESDNADHASLLQTRAVLDSSPATGAELYSSPATEALAVGLGYVVVAGSNYCGHTQGGYPYRCYETNWLSGKGQGAAANRCEALCDTHTWCVGYSYDQREHCALMSSSGSCPEGNVNTGYVASGAAEMTASSYSGGFSCVAKTAPAAPEETTTMSPPEEEETTTTSPPNVADELEGDELDTELDDEEKNIVECQKWCYSKKHKDKPWKEKKCHWNACGGCDECSTPSPTPLPTPHPTPAPSGYNTIAPANYCGHKDGGYPFRCYNPSWLNGVVQGAASNKCEALCDGYDWCLAYSYDGNNHCALMSNTGTCPQGGVNGGKVADVQADLVPSGYGLPYDCMVKASAP